MRIAFDLDETLIPAPGSPMLVERPNVVARDISREPLRAATLDLLRGLGREGHEVWIYTTSLRNRYVCSPGLEERAAELLPVHYFHRVFTLPSAMPEP